MKIKIEGDIHMDDLVKCLWDFATKKENQMYYSRANAENLIRIGTGMLEKLNENHN